MEERPPRDQNLHGFGRFAVLNKRGHEILHKLQSVKRTDLAPHEYSHIMVLCKHQTTASAAVVEVGQGLHVGGSVLLLPFALDITRECYVDVERVVFVVVVEGIFVVISRLATRGFRLLGVFWDLGRRGAFVK